MESKDTSFVLLSRSLKTCSFKRNPERVALWVHLILDANYTDKVVTFNGSSVERKRGQVITSRNQLAIECGLTESSVRAALEAIGKRRHDHHINSEREGRIHRYNVVKI